MRTLKRLFLTVATWHLVNLMKGLISPYNNNQNPLWNGPYSPALFSWRLTAVRLSVTGAVVFCITWNAWLRCCLAYACNVHWIPDVSTELYLYGREMWRHFQRKWDEGNLRCFFFIVSVLSSNRYLIYIFVTIWFLTCLSKFSLLFSACFKNAWLH